MGHHPNMHSFAHTFTPGWMPKTKSLEPHLDEPGNLDSNFKKFPLIFTNYSALCFLKKLLCEEESQNNNF